MENTLIRISFIIPVYNVEKYITRCAESLFRQTMNNLEFIFVDDCSPDNSIKVLKETIEKFPERKNFVKIIRNKENMKQAASRRIGLEHAVGDYILYVDSDDWIEPDMAEILYAEVLKNNLDFAACEFDFVKDGKVIKTARFAQESKNPQMFFQEFHISPLEFSLWNKMIKRSLIEKNEIILDKSITQWEDLAIVFYLLVMGEKISAVQKVLYHYEQGNLNAVSVKMTESKVEERCKAAFICSEFLKEHNLTKQYFEQMQILKFNAKFGFLIYENIFCAEKWRKTFPETNHMWRTYPGLHPLSRLAFLLCVMHIDILCRFLFWIRSIKGKFISKRNA